MTEKSMKPNIFKSVIVKMGQKSHEQKKALIALGVVIVGILITVILVKLKKPPARFKPEILAPLVKVKQISAGDIVMNVSGFGTVRAKVQVEIVPQVPGKVVSISSNFDAGGFIKAGETLIEIDPRDYELAVQQAQAVVAEAQVRLDLEKAEAQVAKKEWQQLHPDSKPTSSLVFREPQIKQVQAQLKSAQAQLAKAQLNLERTKITLPVDAYITSKKVDLGQYVMTGQAVGSAYGIDVFEIELPLEDKDLAWFEIPENPGNNNTNTITTAEVKSDFAGENHIWKGFVKRTVGQVDSTSRMVSVVIEVPRPFETVDDKPVLLPGTFVEVTIKGKVLKNAMALPRSAVHNGKEVWVVQGDRLQIKPLKIVRTDKNFAYINEGLKRGDLIVISSLDTVTEGMKVRTQAQISQ